MKKILCMLAIAGLFASCDNESKVPETTPEPEVKQEVYQPQHTSTTVDLKAAKRYQYFNAPLGAPAASVEVKYDVKKPYAAPIEVIFSYSNGDTYTYTVPAEFGLWKNQVGKFRVVTDKACTVWLQGQTKAGKRIEFVFFGDPANNGKKITPNSVRGTIKYRK